MRALRGTVKHLGWAWLLLFLILVSSCYERFRLPLTPISDPDTWTYLKPGLSQLLGQGFRHTLGQSFLYPASIELGLFLGGDLRFVCALQHAIGLIGGLLLFLAWSRARVFFPKPRRLPEAVYLGLGLFVVIEQQFSPIAIFFEHTLRPESLLATGALLQVLLALEFIRARWVTRAPRLALATGVSATFFSVLLFFLKPAIGLAVIPANLPMLLSLFRPGMSAGRKVVLVLLPLFLVLLLLVLPEWWLRRSDPDSAVFVPETLFTIHADLIERQMNDDLSTGAPLPYPRACIAELSGSLARELKLSAAPSARPYPSLGFNPDYLKSDNSIVGQLQQHFAGNSNALAAFCTFYYLRVVKHQPAAITHKVLRQLGIFYGQWRCPAFQTPKKYLLAFHYERSLHSYTDLERAKMNSYPPTRAYLASCASLSRRSDLPSWKATVFYLRLNGTFAFLCLPFGVIALVLLLTIVSSQGRCGAHWKWPALVTVWLYTYSLGINLTLAIFHSLDVNRYRQLQLSFVVLPIGLSAVLIFEALFSRVRWKKSVTTD
jgi:hypothetical protein